MLDNGQVQRLDTVLLCTGYSLDFPFITPECGVQYTPTRAWPLYRHMINCDHPTMAFVGCIQKGIPVMPVVECQVRYYKVWLDGVFTLPSSQGMRDYCYTESLTEGTRERNMVPAAQQLYPYLDTLAKEAQFEPWGTAIRHMFLASSTYTMQGPCNARNRHYEFLDLENILVNKIEDKYC